MKTALCHDNLLDLTRSSISIPEIRDLVSYYGAICPSCKKEVMFCSGPQKGNYFAHYQKSENCPLYHDSAGSALDDIFEDTGSPVGNALSRLIGRKLQWGESDHVYMWLYHDEYQEGEILGVFQELVTKGEAEDLFRKADSRLYALTRGKSNPYFKRNRTQATGGKQI